MSSEAKIFTGTNSQGVSEFWSCSIFVALGKLPKLSDSWISHL